MHNEGPPQKVNPFWIRPRQWIRIYTFTHTLAQFCKRAAKKGSYPGKTESRVQKFKDSADSHFDSEARTEAQDQVGKKK